MMGLDATRIRSVVRKELRDYRRKRSIVVAMVILPTIFLIQPTLPSSSPHRAHRVTLRTTTFLSSSSS